MWCFSVNFNDYFLQWIYEITDIICYLRCWLQNASLPNTLALIVLFVRKWNVFLHIFKFYYMASCHSLCPLEEGQAGAECMYAYMRPLIYWDIFSMHGIRKVRAVFHLPTGPSIRASCSTALHLALGFMGYPSYIMTKLQECGETWYYSKLLIIIV